MAAFPTEPVHLLESFVRNLLTELSTLFYAFPSSAFTAEDSRMVSKYKHYINDVWDVLSTLLTTDFTANRNHGKPRKTKNRHPTPRFNDTSFNNLEIDVPSNESDATKALAGIVWTTRQILRVRRIGLLCSSLLTHFFQFYLDMLSEPALAGPLENAYFNRGHHGIRVECPPEMHNDVVEEPSLPSIHLGERTLRGALQAGDVDGFGPWEIIISDSASKYLRELRRNDKRKAEIVIINIKYVMLDAYMAGSV